MSYTRTTWIARVGTALNRFLKTNETSTEVELTNDPTGVTTAGTPFTVANMNKIEEGIYDAHVTADANTSNLLANVNQGVKTTDSPTFASVSTTGNVSVGGDFGVTGAIRGARVVTTNGPNRPEDNNDASMPSVGIGGFSYAYHSVNSGMPSITIGWGGTWVYIAFSSTTGPNNPDITIVGRIAGGSSVQGMHSGTSGWDANLYVIAWRIA